MRSLWECPPCHRVLLRLSPAPRLKFTASGLDEAAFTKAESASQHREGAGFKTVREGANTGPSLCCHCWWAARMVSAVFSESVGSHRGDPRSSVSHLSHAAPGYLPEHSWSLEIKFGSQGLQSLTLDGLRRANEELKFGLQKTVYKKTPDLC